MILIYKVYRVQCLNHVVVQWNLEGLFSKSADFEVLKLILTVNYGSCNCDCKQGPSRSLVGPKIFLVGHSMFWALDDECTMSAGLILYYLYYIYCLVLSHTVDDPEAELQQ